MSHLLALLQELRGQRLAMYVGATSLTKFADFLRGYDLAVRRLRPHEADPFLAEFRDWIYRRFQTTENATWEAVILRHSADEAEAVKRFWELLDEFLQQTGSRDVPPAIPTPKRPGGSARTL